jgi:hypothetical protein
MPKTCGSSKIGGSVELIPHIFVIFRTGDVAKVRSVVIPLRRTHWCPTIAPGLLACKFIVHPSPARSRVYPPPHVRDDRRHVAIAVQHRAGPTFPQGGESSVAVPQSTPRASKRGDDVVREPNKQRENRTTNGGHQPHTKRSDFPETKLPEG